MNAELITHVFASLQNLEKCYGNIKRLLPRHETDAEDIVKVLPEQKKVLEQMRRVANKLQLDFAKNDWSATIRMLKIFYGLNYMVRSDLQTAFTRLSGQEAVHFAKLAPIGKEVVFH